MNTEFIPYGPEWQAEMMKCKKKVLVEMLAHSEKQKKLLKKAALNMIELAKGGTTPTLGALNRIRQKMALDELQKALDQI